MDEIFCADDSMLAQALKSKRNQAHPLQKQILVKRLTQTMINLQTCSTIELSVKGILCWFSFPKPLL
jgi:hypothetical protein